MTASNSRVGGYDFHRPLGAGGMGQVWLGSKEAVDGIRKHVAIKLVPSVAASGRARKRFLDEARVSVLLRHSNIVQVFDVGVEGDVGFIVMEWIDGVDLNQAMTQGPWPPHVIGFVIGELLQALDYAHNLQHERRPLELIHRDISPHNVLVSRHGEVKLADFGIARSRVAKATDMGIAGKWRYMAPEQLRGDASRPQTDLYAIGIILHELLGGSPFRSNQMDLARLDVPALGRPAPEALDQLRRWLLADDPGQRPPSARAALRLLQAWEHYRDASSELAYICSTQRHGVAMWNASPTFDASQTEPATGQQTATAVTRTSMLPEALRRDHARDETRRRHVLLWSVAGALAVASAGVGAWQWSTNTPANASEDKFFRAGCPLDANLDGTIDVLGFLARTREPTGNFDMVLIDGSDGHEIRRWDDRPMLSSLACVHPTTVGVAYANSRLNEVWHGGDTEHPFATGENALSFKDGNAVIPVPEALLAERAYKPPFQGTHWTGMSLREDMQLALGGVELTASSSGSETLDIAASGAANWRRTFPRAVDPMGLAASGTTVAVVTVARDGPDKVASLVGLDLHTGETRFELDLGEHWRGMFLVATGDTFVTDFGPQLIAIDIETGDVRWSVGAR